MVRKPDIQYVGQFYIHGSEARKLEPVQEKQPKTRLPLVPAEKVQLVYLDPVAITAIAAAVVLLVTMVAGILAVQNSWQEYEVMERGQERFLRQQH